MVKYNLGRYVTAIVILSIALFLIIAFFRGNLSFNSLDTIWEDVTTTITFVTIICTLFVSWAWKWKIFQDWLVPFPCLSGKWDGEIVSTYNSENRSIPVNVVIKHHFFNIQIKVKTGESNSISTCGSFDIDEDRGLKQLIYSYQNNPKATVRERSEIHYGTTRLEINDDANILEGEYWTSRKTTGDMKLTKM
ncbi:conserved hypothetical protein [uncultured Dysgonomonas sp.]|uniref:CD-NTase-associated protein 15 domain-containing protein n=1 Tax=uncultured Dysgonomonas sp. TaxID=206096 RepID=A0A212JTV8_9BACT|nr:hypothetical protein [uncultured Dysgonomonas sp.]MBS5978732.1 hypothetical protein [Dysgonomonas mossii]SBW02788.1 conserved hypothetical protein [uncultured Dysgonomonas sp.]